MGLGETAGRRDALGPAPAAARQRTPRETAWWYGISEVVGIERARRTGAMLVERLIGQTLKRPGLFGE